MGDGGSCICCFGIITSEMKAFENCEDAEKNGENGDDPPPGLHVRVLISV